MPSYARIATDRREFEHILRSVGSSVKCDGRLPKWPFLAQKSYIHFVEYDRVLGGDFGATLLALARAYGDSSVAFVAVEPSARCYSDLYGTMPGFEVDLHVLEKGYAEGIGHEPGGDPNGALAYASDALAIAGSSGRWGLWGQREWEIALLSTPQDDGPWLRTPVPLYGRGINLESIRSPAGWSTPLNEQERGELCRNIRLRGSGA